MAFLGVDWDSVSWSVVVPILISSIALVVSVWTKWSEGRFRRDAAKAARSADLIAQAGGSHWDGASNTTRYRIHLHNAGQMSAGQIVVWVELRGERLSEEARFQDLAPDGRDRRIVTAPHRQEPLDLRVSWSDGNGPHKKTLLLLDPFS